MAVRDGCGDVAASRGTQADILRRADQQQPGGDEADRQHGEADRQPTGAPAAMRDAGLGDQRQADQPHHLRHRRDRGGDGAAGDEPVVHRAVDAEVERPGEVGAGDAEQCIEHQQRRGERQRHVGQAGQQDGAAQHSARALAVQQAAEAQVPTARRATRRARRRRRWRCATSRSAGVIGSTKMDSVATRAALAREAGAADAAEDDPAVEERQATGEE